MWLILIQRFFYRQFMYIITYRSIIAMLRGRRHGWNKLERTGNVKSLFFFAMLQKNFVYSETHYCCLQQHSALKNLINNKTKLVFLACARLEFCFLAYLLKLS